VDLAAGRKAWSFRDRDAPYFSSPAVTKDRVLFGVIILYFVGAYLSLYYPPMERLLSAMLFR
jgi:type II secretory pathway component PulM